MWGWSPWWRPARCPKPNCATCSKLEEGDEFDFFRARRGVTRIEERLIERGYLQSRVRLERDATANGINLTLRVVEGPIVDVAFEGVTPPARLREEAAALWHRGVFDRQRVDDVTEAVRSWLADANQLESVDRAER